MDSREKARAYRRAGRRVTWRRGTYNTRDSKLATGMSKTAANQRVSDEVLRLLVFGTFDKAPITWLDRRNKMCPCCGHKTGKLELTDAGRRKLNKLRAKRAERG